MIQGNSPEAIEAFKNSAEGQKFVGWGWDGVSTVDVNGETHPADNGVQMYSDPMSFFRNIFSSGEGILSGQPEAPAVRESTGTQIVPQTSTETTNNGETIEDDIENQSSEVPVPYGSQPGGNYEIQPGDNLWRIAQNLDISSDSDRWGRHPETGAFSMDRHAGNIVEQIKAMNPNIKDFDRIAAGGTLSVPVNEQDNFDARGLSDREWLLTHNNVPSSLLEENPNSAPLAQNINKGLGTYASTASSPHGDIGNVEDANTVASPRPAPQETKTRGLTQTTPVAPPANTTNVDTSSSQAPVLQNMAQNAGNALLSFFRGGSNDKPYVAPNLSLAQRQNEIANIE